MSLATLRVQWFAAALTTELALPQRAPVLPDFEAVCAAAQANGAPIAAASGGECTPNWVPTFGGRAGLDGAPDAAIVHDDGSGPALYVGGGFSSANGQLTRSVARWDGRTWSSAGMGPGPGRFVRAFTVHDDGGGARLYCAGSYSGAQGPWNCFVARWDGAWTDVLSGILGQIDCLASYDDSAGPALYFGGNFNVGVSGGGSVNGLARWKGGVVEGVGALVSATNVYDLEVFDDGTGPVLIAAGSLELGQPVGTNEASGKWSSAGWSRLQGAHVLIPNDLEAVYGPNGPELYICGQDIGLGTSRLSRLVGNSWVRADQGILPSSVSALGETTIAGWPEVIACAPEPSQGTIAGLVYHLEGGRWTPIVFNPLNALDVVSTHTYIPVVHEFDEGHGPRLFLGGGFGNSLSNGLHGIVRVFGNTWEPVGEAAPGLESVHVAASFGTGPMRRWVTVRHRSESRHGPMRAFVDAWDGARWTSLGALDRGDVTMLTVLVENGREFLYAGGDFEAIDGVDARGVARFDGSQWEPLGEGVSGRVNAVTLFDAGAGPELIATGSFEGVGGVALHHIARFDGQTWRPLDTGLGSTSSAFPAEGFALAVLARPGQATELYCGGRFQTAGPVHSQMLARWDGMHWSTVGSAGLPGEPYHARRVDSLVVHDLGAGPELIAAGDFNPLVGPLASLVRWDGGAWHTFPGVAVASGGGPQRFLVDDFGDGRFLHFACTRLEQAGVEPISGVARWTGQRFEALAGGLAGNVSTLSVFDDGEGRALHCGGVFPWSPAGDSYLARWRGCDGALGEPYCVPTTPNSTGSSATLAAYGSSNVFERTLHLVAGGVPAASFGVFLTGSEADSFPGYGGSVGALCLGGRVGAFTAAGQVVAAGPSGQLALTVDLGALPLPGGPVAVAPGEVWRFQAWYRDKGPVGITSDFSSALRMEFDGGSVAP